MRGSLFTSLTLGCGALLGLLSFNANAIPIRPGITVNLAPAAGSTSWTSPTIGDPHGTVSLSGWEYDDGAWTSATMTYKSGTPAETGLGVACNLTPTGNACGQHEIGSTPWQMIDMNIKSLTGWSSLTINLGSINAAGTGGDETGYLLFASCQVGGTCTPSNFVSCTDFGGVGDPQTCSFNLTYGELLRVTDIWIAASRTDQSGSYNGNVLLGGTMTVYGVPEPAELGMFGLGLALIGLFAELRRRRTR